MPSKIWPEPFKKLNKCKRFFLTALLGAILWITILTPYMVLIVKTSSEQYLYWLLMEICLVLPASPLVYEVTEYILIKLKLKGN